MVSLMAFAGLAAATVVLASRSASSSSSSARSSKSYPLKQIEEHSSNPKQQFLAVYDFLREDILSQLKFLPQESIQWIQNMMDYNVPGGKLNRGTTVVTVYQAILQKKTLTSEQICRASILGWTIEFLQAFFLVADDIMDDSQTRRGQPCWYKKPNVKMIAINDSFLLESFVFGILKTHFSQENCYPELVTLLLDVTQKTEFGQLLDLTSQSLEGSIDLDRFTMERYRLIVKYKTAYYSFYLPVALGMILAGYTTRKHPLLFEQAENICCQMGEYFQIQDDYLDCFGDPETIGKVGTDIQDNKCSWLIVQALERCNDQQRQALKDNYGKWDDAKVAKIKELYRELDLPKVFREYEEESYQKIQEEMNQVPLPRDVFDVLLSKIYKRSK